ncbi:DUF3649 domain-containing protein [Massilia sp. DJPM01]|uniref:DUF3649 domain-containing protein n=1 Tax=Massilia sp. DJPM01 TaxID=3024404 RepID=UPI00259F344E|nr:DUF3649 domain-containing protein [Massilia sp. DJPM01]MDM5180470.1 DUF3649 domain-containing protein [Massilia sp. DJPM01]
MRLSAPLVYRLGVGSRALAAILGGYLLAAASALLALLLPRVLGTGRADAVIGATLASFAIYAGAVIWVFAARSAARAWLGLLLPAACMAAIVYLLYRNVP